MKKKQMITIPNFLTLFRIILVPIFIYYYLNGDHVFSALLVLICGITDFLDGYIARHCHQVSELGKALDPIADKLLQFAIIFCLVFSIPNMIWLFLLFLMKELSMLICWVRVKYKGGYFNGALWFGKVSTAVFYITMFALLVLPTQNIIYANFLMMITAFFLFLAFVLYMLAYYKMFQNLK